MTKELPMQGPMQGLSKLTRLEAKILFLRDPVALLVALAVPIGILLVFGLPGFARDPAPELGGQRPIDTVLPSIALAISVGVLAITVLPGYLAIYREKGILRRLSTTPASPAMLLTAQVAVNLAMAVAALVLVLAIGAVWLGMAMPASVGWFVVAFLLGTAALFAVGLLIAAVAPTAKTANAIGMLVFFPSLFLAGAWLPKHLMPDLLSRIGDLSPLGAFRESVQDAWVGTTPDPVHLVALAVVAVVAGTAAAKLFRWE
jgi:ABC-2 type transport system permease protein